ncbi:pantetheine-phosphate adenylyltransferase [Desemzia incerta]|uniref:pantetheine-phosphate adenylyltransferase n=1 Tax=Desemzia incerta TaxID=82801 RepID=UPI0024C4692A|nr:pantetheine-phosphate adenylyltransferase [Desemzia incerta]WHZ31504.1 pantetheine-phosphate adenylyltransferase [Desemzia incerta]
MSKIALYAGSFDPVSNGHLNLIQRGAALFDQLIVAVATNTSKKSLFTTDDKVKLMQENLTHLPNVTVVQHTGGLTIDLAKEWNATVLLRGIRNVKDFEYEADVAAMNKTQNKEIETVFLTADEKYRFVSSSLIKEVAMFGGDITGLVPENVNRAMKGKYEIE